VSAETRGMDIRLSLGIPLHLHPPAREGDDSGDSAPGDREDHGEALQRGRFAIYCRRRARRGGHRRLRCRRGADGTSDRDEVMCFSEGFIELFTAYDHVTFEETEEAIAKASIEALANRYRSLLGGVGFVKALREKRGGEGQGSASARWCRPRRARRRHLGHRRTGGHRQSVRRAAAHQAAIGGHLGRDP